MHPLVSVIMPVYNAEKYISASLQSLLHQTYSDFEVILIDDCSSDKSMDIVRSYVDPRLRIIRNPINIGIAASRNRGLQSCKGRYIALLDDDDISLPQRLEKQTAFLDDNKDIDVVGGMSIWIDEEDRIIREAIEMPADPDYIKTSFLFENMYNNSEVMFRRSLVENYGIRYAENMLGMEDFRFWIDCSKKGKFSNLDELILKRRMVSDNTTAKIIGNQKKEREKIYQELQEYSIKRSGFELSDIDYGNIYKFIGESRHEKNRNVQEIRCFYETLKKIIDQSIRSNFANIDMVKDYLRNKYVNTI